MPEPAVHKDFSHVASVQCHTGGMSTITHGFDWPDRFVVGTVGMPGDRTFYLQASERGTTVSVSLEKQQSAALAEGVEELLNRLKEQEGNPFNVPEETEELLIDTDPLNMPVDEAFRVGMLTLGWDPRTSQIVVEAAPTPQLSPEEFETLQEAMDNDEPVQLEVEPEEVLLVRIPVGAAKAFVDRTRAIVESGRPSCPICGEPLDPDGHECADPGDLGFPGGTV